jgi:ABC-type uncharacterized transport system permease subunit
MPPFAAHALLVLGAALYAAASGAFFAETARRGASRSPARETPSPNARPRVLAALGARAPAMLGLGAAAHLGYITIASFVAHTCPVGSVHFLLSMVAIVATAGYLLARANAKHRGPTENLDALGLVVAPFGLAFLLGTYFLDKPTLGRALGAGFLGAHVLVNVIGIALFLLAGAAAVLYLVQERRLKQKRLAGLGALPPLDTLDRAVHRFLLLGFPLLTIGVVSGTFWAQQLESGSPDEVARIVLGYATWLLVAAVLLLRTAAGWSGKRSAYGTILGVLCAMGVVAVYLVRPSVDVDRPASAAEGAAS